MRPPGDVNDEGRATILIIEDDEATCRFLGDNLSADGHEVLVADCARDGMRMLEYKFPDLAVVDLALPDTDGLELISRVRAADGVATRVNPDTPLLVLTGRDGELEVDPPSRHVTLRGTRVELSQKEFALLRTLAAEPTRVFTKEELLRTVWGFRSMGSTRTLDSHACRLRRKLAANGDRFVVNVWGVGYRLIDGLLVAA